MYHEGNRELQDRFETRRLADRLNEVKYTPCSPTTTARSSSGRICSSSPPWTRTGSPPARTKAENRRFVRLLDDRTLVFPSYDGNGMFLSLGNVRQTARVGLLFVDFESPRRLRVNGSATLSFEDEQLGWYPEAQLIVRVTASQIFPNCPRYIHKMVLVKRSAFVPRAGRETPEPASKESEWTRDVLPRRGPSAPPPRLADGLIRTARV